MAAPTFVNAGTVTGSTSAVAIPLPASIAANDILLLWVETENQAVTVSNQNGGTWTEVTSTSPQGTGTAGGPGSTRLTLFWSRYNGTQGNPTISDSGDHQRGVITAYRGVITGVDPWDVKNGDVLTSGSTSVTIPGATTTVADTMVCFGVANTTDSSTTQMSSFTNANLSSVSHRAGANSTTGAGGGLNVGDGVKSSIGAIGNTTGTLVTSSVQGRIMIALKPAANAYTLVADAGSYAATGAVAGVLLGHLLSAAAGSYAVTGTAAGTNLGRAIVASAGSYAQTGTDAVLTYTPSNNKLLAADPGSYSVTGTAASVLLGRKVAADPSSYAVTGSAESLIHAKVVTAAAGSYVQTGTVASPLRGYAVSAGVGAYVLTGQDAQLVYQPATGHVLGAAPGSYALTGTAAAVLKGSAVIIGSGAYSVAGADVELTRVKVAPAIAIHRATVSIPDPYRGTSSMVLRAGSSIMDTYTCDNDTGTADSTAHTADDAPMRFV